MLLELHSSRGRPKCVPLYFLLSTFLFLHRISRSVCNVSQTGRKRRETRSKKKRNDGLADHFFPPRREQRSWHVCLYLVIHRYRSEPRAVLRAKSKSSRKPFQFVKKKKWGYEEDSIPAQHSSSLSLSFSLSLSLYVAAF